MTERFGIFTVADSATSKSWQVKAPGTSLYPDANHMVSVKGLPDPKAPSPILYAENVQNTGQPCGNAAATNGATGQPGAVQGQQAQPLGGANGATASGTTGSAAPSGSAGAAASTGSTGSTTGATGTQNPSTTPATPKAEQGTGAAVNGPASNPATQPSENKGVPNSGTPTNPPPQGTTLR
jgi:hypothetical protein